MLRTATFIFFFLVAFTTFAQVKRVIEKSVLSEKALVTIRLDGYPDFLTADGNDVWVTNINKIQKLSINSSVPVLSVDIPGPCGAPVVAGAFIYVASCKTRSIYKINTRTAVIKKIIPSNIADLSGEISLAYGAKSIWILSDSSGILSRINPRTGNLIATIKVLPHSYCAVYGANSVWVSNSNARGSVQRIDPKTNSVVSTIEVDAYPHFLVAGDKGVFTLNQQNGTVSHIDVLTNRVVATILAQVAGTGGDIDAARGKVWIRSKNGYPLLVIDALTDKIIHTYLPLCGSGAVRIAGNYVWVTAHDIHTIWILAE